MYSPLMVEGGHKYLSNGLVNYNCSFEGSSPTLIEGDIGAKTAFEIAEKLEKMGVPEEKINSKLESEFVYNSTPTIAADK